MQKQHICELCNTAFEKKANLNRHLNKLRSCNVDTGFSCIWCNKQFSTQSNITRHHLNCNAKYQHDLIEKKIHDESESISAQFKLLEAKYELLEKKMLESTQLAPTIITHNNNSNNTTNTNSNNNNNNTHIIINNYGSENMAHITVQGITFVFNKCFKSVRECVKLIHFSPLAPENRNVCIKDMKSKYAYIFCHGNWDITGRTELIDDMYNEICDYIETKFNELKDEIDEKYVLRIQRFLEKRDDKKTQNTAKDDLIMLLFNQNKHRV